MKKYGLCLRGNRSWLIDKFNPLWGLLWVVPAYTECYGVFDGLKKASIYAPMTLSDRYSERSAKSVIIYLTQVFNRAA